MSGDDDRHWHVVRTVELGGPAAEVWAVVGGFFNIHTWHPDIENTEILPEQVHSKPLRRLLTFPGQPKTTEQLVMMDDEGFHYRYKWHSGDWGERVKNYASEIRVLDLDRQERCVMQWSCHFDYPTDAISDFYQHGFDALRERFPLSKGG